MTITILQNKFVYFVPVLENILWVGDGGWVPGELQPAGGVRLDLQEVGRGGGPVHHRPVPRHGGHVDLDEGGGEGGAPVVPGHHEEPVQVPCLEASDNCSRDCRVDLLEIKINWSLNPVRIRADNKYILYGSFSIGRVSVHNFGKN